jgi:predicted ATPase/DNA-binding SARP family transcriptional activator
VVWRLRSALEPGRAPRETGTVLQKEAAGYRLAAPLLNVDSAQFVSAAQRSAELLALRDAAAALEVSEAALALWRGEPFEGVRDAAWLEPVRERLSGLRLDISECHVQALLESGQPERAVSELVPLLAAQPFRERYWAQRMLGLYRSGRQAAALDAFAEARRILADELGVDPGPDLRRMHERILAQDRGLDGPLARSRASAPGSPANLPSRRTRLIGRDQDVDSVLAQSSGHRLVTLIGPGGAGKTRLAIECAHRLRLGRDDGVRFVDLAPVAVGSGAAEIWDELAAALELRAQPGTPSRRLVLDQVAGAELLLVLDNCEHVAARASEVVDELLERCSGLTVLATSREPLMVAGERTWPVEPLDDAAAIALFADRLSDLRPDLDPDGADRAAIAEICAAMGCLPLGIELAAARARVFELREIASSLATSSARLERPGRGPARHNSMLDAVDWSYQLALPDVQVLHRRLACLPGAVTLDAIRALCSVSPLTTDQAPDLVSALAHQSLLSVIRPSSNRGQTMFRQLVPTRAHADRHLDPRDRAAVDAARDAWVAERIMSAPLDGRIGQAEASEWIADNMTAVRATLASTLISDPDRIGLELVARLTIFWFERGRMLEAGRWFRAVATLPIRISIAGVDSAVAAALVGCAQGLIQDREGAEQRLAAALPDLIDPPAEHAVLVGEVLVLIATAAWVCRLSELGLSAATAAVAAGETFDRPHVTTRGRALQAMHRLWLGDRVTSLLATERVLADPGGNEFAAFVAAYARSRADRDAGDPAAALGWMRRAAQAHQALGMHPTSELLEDIARLLELTGSSAEAVRCLGAAAELHAGDGLSWPRQPETRQALERLEKAMPVADYERLWAAGQRLGQADPEALLNHWLQSS